MKYLFSLITLCFVFFPIHAQTNAKIKELEKKRTEIQKQIQETQSLLTTTNRDVKSQLNSLSSLNGQIEERKRYIQTITNDIETIDRELVLMGRQLTQLEKQLTEKKDKYEASVKYLQRNKTIHEKLLFILSANTLEQTYRRLRYVREYATYQRLQAEEIVKKQEQIHIKKQELEHARASKQDLLKEREQERMKLLDQEKENEVWSASCRKNKKGCNRRSSNAESRPISLITKSINSSRKRLRKHGKERKKRRAGNGRRRKKPILRCNFSG